MNKKKNYSKIKIKDEKGNIKECDVLYIFTPKKSNLSYIVYTDNVLDDGESKRVYANIIKENSKELMPLKTEEEWYTVEAILTKLEEKKNKEVEG